jgi:hypothetical protein
VADIDVERKSGPPIWAWLLGLLVLALLIWLIASMLGRDDTQPVPSDPARDTLPTDVGVAAVPPTLREFRQACQVEEGVRTEEMGREHEFTVQCFERLANAMDDVARQHPGEAEVGPQIEAVRENARQIRESDPESVQHSNWTREAAEAGAAALATMQQRWFAGEGEVQGAVSDVRDAAGRVDRQGMLMDQMTHLRSYFRRAGDALEGMAQRQPAR